jgi:methionyl-tRNA formyltransferase
MRIKILGDNGSIANQRATELAYKLGHILTDNSLSADVSVAPLLTEILPIYEIIAPKYGALIFHPSPLPYGRGAAAIRWAYKRNEPVTAATWFWADAGIDSGPICEQEIVKIDYSLRPKDFYEIHIIPAMLRTLERCLINLQKGDKRQVKQIEDYATYDRKAMK